MDLQQYIDYLQRKIEECKQWEGDADSTVLASWSAGNRSAYEDVVAQLQRMQVSGTLPIGEANHG